MSDEVERQKPGPDAILDNPAKREELLSLISMGLSQTDAYAFVGLDQKAVHNYRKSHPAFEAEIQRALLASKVHHLRTIHAGSTGRTKQKSPTDGRLIEVPFEGDWKASAWYLARRWPEEFAERQKHEVTGANGGAIQTEAAVTITTDLERCSREFEQFAQQQLGAGRVPPDGGEQPVPDEAKP